MRFIGGVATKGLRRCMTAQWIYNSSTYILEMGVAMQVAKWGNSLAVRLPAVVVDALQLKEGDDIEIQVVGDRAFDIQRRPSCRERLTQLRKFRGRMPEDFKFDRLEAHDGR